jgi:hypothetical protein
MGDSGHRYIKGLEAASITLDFLNDLATTTSVTPVLQAAYGTQVTVLVLQNKSAAVSATNPLYTMTVLVNHLSDVNGATGDLSVQNVTWDVCGTVAVTTTGTF